MSDGSGPDLSELESSTIDELAGDVPLSVGVDAAKDHTAGADSVMERMRQRRLEHRLEMLAADLHDRRQTTALRWSFGAAIKWAMIGTLIATGALMAAYLVLTTFYGAKFDSAVLIAWFSSTVVQVIGLAFVVANYLFPKQPDPSTAS